MSLTAAAIRLLASKGLSIEDIAQVADANAPTPPAEAPEARAKRLAAERQARRRARIGGADSVTKRDFSVTERDEPASRQSVTKRDIVTESHAPLARVEDKPITTVPEFNWTTLDYHALDRAKLDAIEAALTEAAGSALASPATHPRLLDLSPVLGLLRGGAGPPCDMEADVLPALRMAGARASPGSIKTWAYFGPAIVEARDRRLTGAPQVIPLEPRNDRPDAPSHRRAARESNHARALAGASAAAAARAGAG